MNRSNYAGKLLLLPLLLSACTFGEGPELTLPESEDEITLDSSNTAVLGADQDDTLSDPQSNIVSDGEVVVEPYREPETVQAPIVTPTDSPLTESQSAIVRIPATDSANAPKIDGSFINYINGSERLDGEWRFAAQGTDMDIANLMFGALPQSSEPVRHHWAAMHDGEYLYLLVVSDDAAEHYQDTDEARKPWKDDSIEIFIDGNNSALESYDGVDDFHMTINLQTTANTANSSGAVNPKIRQSDFSATLPADLSFATGPLHGPMAEGLRGRKDIYEVRIKLSELNIELDKPFGIEIQINDDDNGGTRDRKWGWEHPAGTDDSNDYTWQNPGFMGKAVLSR